MREFSSKRKIAFFNFTQNTIERGAETFVRELSSRLKERYEVAVFHDKNKLIRRLPFFWRFYIDPQGIQILLFTLDHLKDILKNKYDIVIPLNGGWQPVILRFITWIYGGRMVISGQSGKGWDDRNNLLIFPNAFVALSTNFKNWAKKVNPFVRVLYIPNGVDLNKFKPVGEKINFDLPRPIILCVGALTSEKRISLTIKAVSKLKKVSLVVVGDGSEKASLADLGKKLLGERFFMTKSSFEELPKYYRGADLFTLASPSYRSFEIVIVEAMASNLPVVVNNDPIRKEIVDDAGVFVDPENISEYAKALEKAFDTKWDNKPRKQAGNFSWDKITIEYEKLFRELLQ